MTSDKKATQCSNFDNKIQPRETNNNPKMSNFTLTNHQIFRGGNTYEGMDPGIKRESEERVTCANGGTSGTATEDLGSKTTQLADQQSETLNLTKVLIFSGFSVVVMHANHVVCIMFQFA